MGTADFKTVNITLYYLIIVCHHYLNWPVVHFSALDSIILVGQTYI